MADLLDSSDVDFTFVLNHTEPCFRPPDDAEPCEHCGTTTVVMDPLELMYQLSGQEMTRPARPALLEVHTADGRQLALRRHTPERCRRARAGDPEPLTDPDDEELDDA